MTLYVDDVEAAWITLNAATLLLTAVALIEAERDRRAVRILNGRARELATAGAVRREVFRLAVQACFIATAVPGLFVDRDLTIVGPVAFLMTAAVLILASSIFDARERRVIDRELAVRWRQATPP